MGLLRRFSTSAVAVIATEFALVAPLMVTIWFGIVEMSSAYLVLRRVEIAAQSAADLIAQYETVTPDQLTDIGRAVDAVLNPYPDSSVPTKVGWNMVSIEADDAGTNTVVSLHAGGSRTVGDPDASVAGALNSTNDSVIVVSVEYFYASTLFSTLIQPFSLTERAFARPRLVPVITRVDP